MILNLLLKSGWNGGGFLETDGMVRSYVRALGYRNRRSAQVRFCHWSSQARGIMLLPGFFFFFFFFSSDWM